MKIVAISDIHGKISKIDVPPCDLLLLAGDIAPWYGNYSVRNQAEWINSKFRKWCITQPAKEIVFCPGNHEFVFENNSHMIQNDIRCKFLIDDFVIIDGFKVYCSPWQIHFCNWAFNEDEETLAYKWSMIPDDIDILVTHSPPYGYGDTILQSSTMMNEHLGSPSLTSRIQQLKNLQLNVFGHIHSGDHKRYILRNGTILQNVSVLDEAYEIYSNYEMPIFNLTK